MDDARLGAPVVLSLLSLCEHAGELFARYALKPRPSSARR
jgi:hypothetical protein